MEKEIDHMQKGIKIILCSVVLVLLFFIAFHYYRLAWSDLFFKIHIRNSLEWQLDSLGDVAIPKEVSVYFVTKIQYPSLISDNKLLGGFYLSSKRAIFIRDSLTDEEKRSTLVHELAHDTYHHYFDDRMREVQEETYDIVCKDSSEYYAYSQQFDYDMMRG